MNSTISRVAGVASVVVFAGLLTFIVYTQVQSEPDVVEEQYPPATHPLVGFDQDDVPKTPFPHGGEIQMVDLIESVSVDCTSGAPRLSVRTKEELPRNATIRIIAQGRPSPDIYGNLRRAGLGSDEFVVEGGSRDERIALSDSLRSHLADGADSVAVIIAYTGAAGSLFESLTGRIAAADLTC